MLCKWSFSSFSCDDGVVQIASGLGVRHEWVHLHDIYEVLLASIKELESNDCVTSLNVGPLSLT